jgi:hypothetical protein
MADGSPRAGRRGPEAAMVRVIVSDVLCFSFSLSLSSAIHTLASFARRAACSEAADGRCRAAGSRRESRRQLEVSFCCRLR